MIEDFQPAAALDRDDGSLSDTGAELIQKLEASRGARCASCRQALCFHQVLMSIALGSGNAPRCLACTAKVMEQTPAALAQNLFNYIQNRACYRAAWKWASEREGVDPVRIPACAEGAPC